MDYLFGTFFVHIFGLSLLTFFVYWINNYFCPLFFVSREIIFIITILDRIKVSSLIFPLFFHCHHQLRQRRKTLKFSFSKNDVSLCGCIILQTIHHCFFTTKFFFQVKLPGLTIFFSINFFHSKKNWKLKKCFQNQLVFHFIAWFAWFDGYTTWPVVYRSGVCVWVRLFFWPPTRWSATKFIDRSIIFCCCCCFGCCYNSSSTLTFYVIIIY